MQYGEQPFEHGGAHGGHIAKHVEHGVQYYIFKKNIFFYFFFQFAILISCRHIY